MSNNIYPDLTNSKFDIKYIPALALTSDISIPAGRIGARTGVGNSPPIENNDPNSAPFIHNIDGGFAASAYLTLQNINGGGA